MLPDAHKLTNCDTERRLQTQGQKKNTEVATEMYSWSLWLKKIKKIMEKKRKKKKTSYRDWSTERKQSKNK